MTNATTTPIYYTDRKNDLGDVLCVVDAYSDAGQRGWMICEEIRAPGRRVSRSPLVWYPQSQRKQAITAANTEQFYGFNTAHMPADLIALLADVDSTAGYSF